MTQSPRCEYCEAAKPGYLCRIHANNLRDQLATYREALEKVKAHGCCVMHSDRGCPGCIAHDALARQVAIDDTSAEPVAEQVKSRHDEEGNREN